MVETSGRECVAEQEDLSRRHVSCFHEVADREHDPNKGRYFEQDMR